MPYPISDDFEEHGDLYALNRSNGKIEWSTEDFEISGVGDTGLIIGCSEYYSDHK